MSARKKGRDVHGIILLDKPAGYSSNQTLQKVRRLLDARKAGHTGTLDPFATGMLPLCLGEASKTAGLIMDGRKSYTATLLLGHATATGDTEGEVVDTQPVPCLDQATIETAMAQFRGPLKQIPPMYSAIKQDGKPLYVLARQGIVVDRPARDVEIFHLGLLSWQPPLLIFEVVCSKGTYIRTLAEDLSRVLGTCGHLQSLRRTAVEPFIGRRMYTLSELEDLMQMPEQKAADFLLPADAGLPDWPVVELRGDSQHKFVHGNTVDWSGEAGKVRVHGLSEQGHSSILGLGEIREPGRLHPLRVFASGVNVEPCLSFYGEKPC